MQKIQIAKKDRSVRSKWKHLGVLNYYSLKTGKLVDLKKALSYSLSLLPSSICKSDGTRRQTVKWKLKDILLQDLEDHTNEGSQSLQEYAIVVDMIALMNTILNKSSTHAVFTKLFVQRIPKFTEELT